MARPKILSIAATIALLALVAFVLTASAAGSLSWNSVRPIPQAISGPNAVALGGKIYVIGGSVQTTGDACSDGVQRYDPATDTWEDSSKFDHMSEPKQQFGAVAVNDKIWVIGGVCSEPARTRIEVFDPNATDVPGKIGRWSIDPAIPSLPEGRRPAPAVFLNNKVYVIGGTYTVSNYGAYRKTVWALDTLNLGAGWVALPETNDFHVSDTLAVFNGKIYILGGLTNSVEMYDPSSGQGWVRKAATLPAGRSEGRFAGAAMGGKFYMVGGYHWTGSTHVLDPYVMCMTPWPIPGHRTQTCACLAATLASQPWATSST